MLSNAKLPEDRPERAPDFGGLAPEAVDVQRNSGCANSELVEIVQQHHQAVYRYAFRLSGDSHDAEDLTQQTFLVAREKIAQVRDTQATRAWLYTVLRNCFLKELRQRPRGQSTSLDEIAAERAVAPAADAFDREGLELALGRLSDEFRLPILMFYFEELSYREIAAALSLPVGTVMSRLARAKAHLRRYWLEEEPSEQTPLEATVRFAARRHSTRSHSAS
jgi:RNA polymerase sigma-70 factor (ECF subfamily)